MSDYEGGTATERRHGPPPLNWKGDPRDHADNCRRWITEGLYYDHPVRVRDMSTNRRAELFDQGAQNLQRAPMGYDASGMASGWVDTYWLPKDEDKVYLPSPVLNEGLPARQNESARLARPNFRPTVQAKGKSPDLKERLGAETMQHALRHRLREMENDKDMSLFYHRMPIHGGAWLKSELVLSYDKTTPVPVLTAVACPNEDCDLKLASQEVPRSLMGKLGALVGGNQIEGPGLGQEGRADVRVTACPRCDDHPPLMPFKPSLEEAGTLKDSVGRPMGTTEPIADWVMSCPSDYDMFPANLGANMQPGRIHDWTEALVWTLDDIALRWPKLVGEVKPENAATLAKYHPVLGSPDVFQGMLAYKSFAESCRVIARYKKPWMECVTDDKGRPELDAKGKRQYRMNRGRALVMAGNVVLLDKEYLFQSLTDRSKWIPRCYVDWVPWEFKDGGARLRGLSLWDSMYDAQIGSNDTWGQTQAVRATCAVPLYLFSKSANLEVKALGWGIPGAAVTIDVDPNEPVVEPKLINNTTIDAGVGAEKQGYVDFIARLALADIEKGNTPPGVSAAVALDSLKAAASELRAPRIDRAKAALQRCWKHGAEIIQAVYLEDREIRVEDEDGHENWQMVSATDFASEIEVAVEGEPDVEEQARDIEVIRDQITQGIIDPAQLSPASRRRIAKIMRAPDSLFEDEDLQTDNAQREWLAFKDSGRVPYVDPGLDDNSAHYEDHGRKAMSAHMRDLEERAHWDDALKILGTSWDETLTALMMKPGPPCLQDRIFDTWKTTLSMAAEQTTQAATLGGIVDQATGEILTDPATGEPVQPMVKFSIDDEEALDAVLAWRAHMAAHKLEDEKKQMRARMAPTLAAPGAETTEAGNQVTSADPAATTEPASEAAPAA